MRQHESVEETVARTTETASREASRERPRLSVLSRFWPYRSRDRPQHRPRRMAKFMCDDTFQLSRRQRLNEWQSDAHDTSASNSHHSTPVGDPRIHLIQEINVTRHFLIRSCGNVSNHGKQTGSRRFLKARTRGFKTIRPRYQCPEHGKRASDARRENFDVNPTGIRPLRVRNPKETQCNY